MSNNWTATTIALGGSEKFTVKAKPLYADTPMGLTHINVEGDGNSLTLLLTVDQADQLEQELERARWHRVFAQRELADHAPQAAPAPEEPAEEPAGDGEYPPQAESRTGAE